MNTQVTRRSSNTRALAALATLTLVVPLAGYGCSSAGANNAKPGGDGGAKPKPTTHSPAPAPKPTVGTKPPAMPPKMTPAPTTTVTTNLPPTIPLAYPEDLSAPEAFSLGSTCPAGLDPGKGFCFPDLPTYLDGCTTDGKYQTLLCSTFDDATTIGYCDVLSGAVGCWVQALTKINSVDFANATDPSLGTPVDPGQVTNGLASCDASAHGAGYCEGDNLYVCNSDGTMWGLNCNTAYGGLTCKANPDDATETGCF
jgi:hypothetical protein